MHEVFGARLDISSKRFSDTCAMACGVGELRFVSASRADLLGALHINTVGDLLMHAPFRYLDFTCLTTLARATVSELISCIVKVDTVTVKRPRPRLSVVEVACYDETGIVMATFFGQPWLAQTFAPGQTVLLSGKLGFSYGFKTLNSPYFEILSQDDTDTDAFSGSAHCKMLPVHHTTEGLSAQWLRRFVSEALARCGSSVDPFPSRVRAELGLMSRRCALRSIHFPSSAQAAEDARKRLAFEEAASLQLALRLRAEERKCASRATEHVRGGVHFRSLLAALPFELTSDQKTAVEECVEDMASSRSMHRLLLGDVGCGKTAVATLLLGLVADTATQAAVMAPTSVLAAQYAESVAPLLEKAGISWSLLTGATPAAERVHILEDLARGELCVVFGTHALIQPDVVFAHLSLVVIDEQHRFGVKQRDALHRKGAGADLLYMSATPIPRTLALALYADLDCSYLRTRPRSGAGVTTTLISKSEHDLAYEAIRTELDAGRQAYIICPLIGCKPGKDGSDVYALQVEEGADPSDVKAAEAEADYLRCHVFENYCVGLLTGRMSSADKIQAMQDFKAGRTQVLVSTTVVEVGVDVPNATVMLIEDAERFGLAQLHQLRGRVGRGQYPGKVFLCADSTSDTAARRLTILETTGDGFEVAAQDLKLRHEGDILGVRQAGQAYLRFIDFARDASLIEASHVYTSALMNEDPFLSAPSHRVLRYEVYRRFPEVFSDEEEHQ